MSDVITAKHIEATIIIDRLGGATLAWAIIGEDDVEYSLAETFSIERVAVEKSLLVALGEIWPNEAIQVQVDQLTIIGVVKPSTETRPLAHAPVDCDYCI